MSDQPAHVWGSGERVVLVHGAVTAGEETWQAQRPLAERWELVVPDRGGYDADGPEAADDPVTDAAAVADLLGEQAHLVGYSLGASVAMLAAAQRPEAVRSLVLVEPFALRLVPDRADAAEFAAAYARIRAESATPDEFLRTFLVFFGADPDEVAQIPTPMPPSLGRAAYAQHLGPLPWDLEVPLDALAAAPYPIVIVSGAHSAMLDAVCDTLQARIGGERVEIGGAGHGVQFTGPPFNELLERTWGSAP